MKLFGLIVFFPALAVFPNKSFFGFMIILTKVFEDYYEDFK